MVFNWKLQQELLYYRALISNSLAYLTKRDV